MATLFPIEQLHPPGFEYEENFISLEEEQQLIAAVKNIELKTFVFQGYEAKRKVKSYGYDYMNRRSLYVMKGESRTDWQHSTAAVRTVRYSITLRTLRKPVL